MKGLVSILLKKFPEYIPMNTFSKGIANFLFRFANWEEICEILKGMPRHLTLESYDAAMSIVRAEAAKPNTPKCCELAKAQRKPLGYEVFMLSAEFDEGNRLDRNQLYDEYR
jgi:hypothetical protein